MTSMTQTDENYLREVYTLQLEHERATTSMLAGRFGTSAATVTGMLKKLSERGWIEYEPYRGAALTASGKSRALEVIRRHRLIETFLAETLGVPWDRVHAEAELLEHALSDYLAGRIDDLLGHPEFDPHGSPIPASDGTIAENARVRLADLGPGSVVQIVEVSDRDREILLRLDELGMRPGTRARIESIEPVDELLTVEIDGARATIGHRTARNVYVRCLE